jgi:hypothetical protein
MILYCFISHGSVVINDYHRISSMMQTLNYDEYCIIYGGNNKNIQNKYVTHIECQDGYCDLPEKINKSIKYISNLNKYDYIFKCDRTGVFTKIFDESIFYNIDYGGKIIKYQNPTFHFQKCEKTSKWHDKPFNGEKIFYCSGGGYIFSKKGANFVSMDDSYSEHVYEDYYIGSIMKKSGILPKKIDIKDYFYDTEHPKLFT